MDWSFPPELPWPRFLRQLKDASAPASWLEAAALHPEVRKRPQALRWIAQHRRSPPSLRLTLLPRLPWRLLISITNDTSSHPQAQSLANERLLALWPGLSSGERRSLARLAPRQLWLTIWKDRHPAVLRGFLENGRLGLEPLIALLQAPLSPAQSEALLQSRWFGLDPLAHQFLWVLDQTLERQSPGIVLGMATPWILSLNAEARLLASTRLRTPALRRLTRGTPSGSNALEDLVHASFDAHPDVAQPSFIEHVGRRADKIE